MATLSRVLFVALLGATLISSVAAAEQPATTDTQTAPPQQQVTPAPTDKDGATPAPAADDDKIVCKNEPPPIGSRMGGKKVCRTVAEWRRIQAAAKETTDEIQNRKVPPPAF